AGKSLHKFLDGKQFHGTYKPSNKPKITFAIDRGIYDRTHEEANVALNNKGKATLWLYPTSNDEFNAILKAGPYNRFLCVETRIRVKFKFGLDPAPADWEKNKAYAVGTLATNGEQFVVCKTAHTSGNSIGADAAKWAVVSAKTSPAAWAVGTD